MELSTGLDTTAIWTWFLLVLKFGGIFMMLPGVGTDQIQPQLRLGITFTLALAVTLSGLRAPAPENYLEAGITMGSEFALGFVLGLIPALVVSGVTVAGQVVTGAIGLGQANMIDPSLGASVALLSRIQGLFASLVFLFLDGHHAVIRAAVITSELVPMGTYRPQMGTATFIVDRFVESFALSVTIAAPTLITVLLTQFVLGLVTKFIPQVNIFIVSLPLTIFVGLYITLYTFPRLHAHVSEHFISFIDALPQLVLTP